MSLAPVSRLIPNKTSGSRLFPHQTCTPMLQAPMQRGAEIKLMIGPPAAASYVKGHGSSPMSCLHTHRPTPGLLLTITSCPDRYSGTPNPTRPSQNHSS
ncbi:rCG63130 [Rattus norvegicus]|uniref:RCG63130 n=1 Tax=Rattus norvegicus TaxID=10116 RepID=A6KCC9_RAT|nr:rCG63130 [Rattus norvegicus]